MRPTFVALLLVASACAPPAGPGTDSETDPGPDTDVPPDTDRETDTELPAETDVVDTDSDTDSDPDSDTDTPVDTEPPVDTDTDPPADTDTEPPTHTGLVPHTDTDDSDVVCRGDLDQIGDVYGPPVRADIETLDALDAWVCLVDPDRAATCPPAREPCRSPPGLALTAVLVQTSTYVAQYALYDGAGHVVAYAVSSDAEEFCGYTQHDLWLGDIAYGGTCATIISRGTSPSPCGPPLLCTSTP